MLYSKALLTLLCTSFEGASSPAPLPFYLGGHEGRRGRKRTDGMITGRPNHQHSLICPPTPPPFSISYIRGPPPPSYVSYMGEEGGQVGGGITCQIPGSRQVCLYFIVIAIVFVATPGLQFNKFYFQLLNIYFFL